jgi:hypothetical protein
MRAQDELRMGSALRIPMRELFDQADVVGSQIGEHMLDAQIGEPLQEVMGAAGAGGGLWGHEGEIVEAGPSRTAKDMKAAPIMRAIGPSCHRAIPKHAKYLFVACLGARDLMAQHLY